MRPVTKAICLLFATAGILYIVSRFLGYRASFEAVQSYHRDFPHKEFAVPSESPTETLPTLPLQTALPETTDAPDTTAPVTYPLDLNTATVQALATLPGIGEVTAQAIVDARTQRGGFTNRAQLLEVSGIGEARYAAIYALLYIPDEQPLTEPTASPETTSPPQVQPATASPEPPIVNLNTTTRETLLLLPGCTEEIADSILYLRDVQIHHFQSIFELLYAEGVSDTLFLSWQPYLAVDDSGSTQLPDPRNPTEGEEP